MDAPPMLHVRLFGELELRRGGTPVPLPPSRRTRALLGYLVATAAPHSRSALCDLLWDGPDDPRAALRWSLTKLRPLVDDAAVQRLHADRDKVAFEARDCAVDSVRLGALADRGDLVQQPLDTLEDAARALDGEFLDGLELPACYRFHHWCMAERERFAALRRGVLQALIARLADDPARSLPHARALVAADPLADAAHATLVRVLAAAGRYPDAERHYAWARELLRREVALGDGGVLDETIRQVRRQQRLAAGAGRDGPHPPPSPASGRGSPAGTPLPAAPERASAAPAALPAAGLRMRSGEGSYRESDVMPKPEDRVEGSFLALARPHAAAVPAPLVGRGAEVAALEAALAHPHEAPVLLLVGEPGIGKTRLLDHLAERAGAAGVRIVRARCFEAEAVRPYGFWLDALRGVPTDGVSAEVRDRIAPLLGGGTGAVSREHLFDAAAALLGALAQTQPLLIVVDDLQWIDDASAALLHLVARQLAAPPLPVLLAAAARAGEIDDNAAAKSLLQSLQRERSLQRIALHPLGADDVQRWLGDRLPDVAAAVRDSGGNPLYLIELARAAASGAAAGGRPLEALIEDRLRALDDAARDLVGWAAALGGEFDPDRLAAATALPVPEVLGRIAQFERRGLLRATGDGGFDFVHGLVRQAVYRALSTPRRRALHRQIARAFAAASADDPWLHGAVVHHASLAGDALVAARAALAAGLHWLRVFANVEAGRVAERGLALLEEIAPGAERARLEIALLRLHVSAAAGTTGGRRLPALAERIRQAIDAAAAHALHAEAAAGWEILSYWCQQTGDAAGAREASLAAEACTRRADDVTRCQQMANTGRCLFDIEADTERGRTLLADAAVLAAELQLSVMEIEWGRGLVARADGDLSAARAALGRAVGLARAAANHWREYECMLAQATVELELGLADDVLRHVDEVRAAARRMGDAEVPFADALAALARRQRGESAADAAVEASLAALRKHDDKARLAYALNAAAAFALAAGDRAAAVRHAGEALAAAAAVRRPTQIARAEATLAAAAAARAPITSRHPEEPA